MICPSCRTDNPEPAGLCRACGGPLRPVAPGTLIAGRYEILDVLGRGGMGTVYSAHDRAIDDTVAIKVLRPEIAGSPDLARRFASEVRLARRVSHRNVCRIYEYGEDAGLRFLVMELVDGRDLKRVLSSGPLPPAEARAVAIQAAEALQAIHDTGIVHRDLKTANLMRDGTGTVKVMDFGIARRVEPGAAPSGYVVGTPEYMSPEQGRGRPVDARSDVYALGVVTFELFTGRVPFHADTPVATLMQHVEAPPPLDDPALPADVAALLARALAKDPQDRLPTARAFAEALRGGPGPRPPRARGRRTLAVAAALLAIAASVALWQGRDSPRQSPATAVSSAFPPRETASPPPLEETAAPPTEFVAPVGSTHPRAVPPPTPRPPAVAAAPPALEASRSPAVAATATPEAPSPAPITPAPAGEAPPAQPATGALVVVARPWADVTIDGIARGQTPLAPFVLEPGAHQVVLSHPDYQPVTRRVRVRAGETTRLVVVLADDAVRRRR